MNEKCSLICLDVDCLQNPRGLTIVTALATVFIELYMRVHVGGN